MLVLGLPGRRLRHRLHGFGPRRRRCSIQSLSGIPVRGTHDVDVSAAFGSVGFRCSGSLGAVFGAKFCSTSTSPSGLVIVSFNEGWRLNASACPVRLNALGAGLV